jgi:hypothetical protein
LWPIEAIGHAYAGLLRVFSLSTWHKRSQVDAKAFVFNRGMIHQTKEKGFIKMNISFVGG